MLPSKRHQPDAYPPPVYDNIYIWTDRNGGKNRKKKDNTENSDIFEKEKEKKSMLGKDLVRNRCRDKMEARTSLWGDNYDEQGSLVQT